MKLKNKKTGEIGNLKPYNNDKRVCVWIDNVSEPDYIYNSLAELSAEWEDAPEEPKEIHIEGIQNVYMGGGRVYIDYASAQEAELAVRKLKAWKRLKDKGFRFDGYGHYDDSGDESPAIAFEYPDLDEMFYNKQLVADLDLLFGGVE